MNDFQNIEYSVINTAVFSLSCDITSNTLAGTYQYEGNKPHAVTSVTPSSGFPDAISSAQCETEYNCLGQPSRIAEGNVEILLEYGADGQRVKTVYKNNGNVVLLITTSAPITRRRLIQEGWLRTTIIYTEPTDWRRYA